MFIFALLHLCNVSIVECFLHLNLVYKKEDVEKMEPEMEIGYPTDVKHVTHIGIDGSTTITNNVKGWDNLKAPELLSLSPISFKQFELAMASQAQYPLINDPNSSKCG